MSSMIGFRPSEHNIPEDDYPEEIVLPAGEYEAVCINISEGSNRYGDPYVVYKWKIQSGQYAGQVISNFENPSPNDEQKHGWYMKRLKSLMTICGIEVIDSLDQLQMIPVIINNKPYTNNNGAQSNSINYYKRVGSNGAPNVSNAPSQAAGVPASPVQAAPVVQQQMPQQGVPVASMSIPNAAPQQQVQGMTQPTQAAPPLNAQVIQN